jgi:hypothetical protein
MPLQLDHVFICVAPGAPEADALLRLGLREGSSPELAYLPFALRADARPSEPTAHAVAIQEMTGVAIGLPRAVTLSTAARAAQAEGLAAFRPTAAYVLELQFNAERAASFDVRPTLPLILRGVPARGGVAR